MIHNGLNLANLCSGLAGSSAPSPGGAPSVCCPSAYLAYPCAVSPFHLPIYGLVGVFMPVSTVCFRPPGAPILHHILGVLFPGAPFEVGYPVVGLYVVQMASLLAVPWRAIPRGKDESVDIIDLLQEVNNWVATRVYSLLDEESFMGVPRRICSGVFEYSAVVGY